MALTFGIGPLSGKRAGPMNFSLADAPAHRLYLHDEPRRIRALIGDRVVLDTSRAKLLHESNIMPRVYAPLEDFDAALLSRTETSTHCPFKGDATYYAVTVAGRRVEDAVWTYEQPQPEAAWLEGLAAPWPERFDAWFVEDDRVLGHLRDPFHRVDAHPSSREVVVTVGGTEVARTQHPVLVFETGLPPRAYVPPADVRPGAIAAAASGRRAVCPYKGEASYWDVAGVPDAAWSYESPLPDALRATRHLCFDASLDGVEVAVGAPA